MITFEFEKQGFKFCFRNPKWEEIYRQLRMEWKVIGIKENNKNDGYYCNSRFLVDNNAMELNGVKINGKEIRGVGLPENILSEIKKIYEQSKDEDLQKRLNQDIKYLMNDNTSYGIYNGISEFDIAEIVLDIKKQCNSDILIFAEDVAKILNRDEELKPIAWDTYTPYPMNNSWREEIKELYPKRVEEKKAEGYGTIPNRIIREKITKIILEKTDKENQTKQIESSRVNNLFELAKQTGEKQLINHWMEDCNNPKEECSLDVCREWAMPDGTRKITRNHTW